MSERFSIGVARHYLYWPIRLGWSWHFAGFGWHGWEVRCLQEVRSWIDIRGEMQEIKEHHWFGWTLHCWWLEIRFGRLDWPT